jgi:hypothetical protein
MSRVYVGKVNATHGDFVAVLRAFVDDLDRFVEKVAIRIESFY